MPRFTSERLAGFSVERFVSSNVDRYVHADQDEETLRDAFLEVQTLHAPALVRADALLDAVKQDIRLIPTGCAAIDTLISGGLREGHLTEVYGESGSGKSQLCMMTAAKTASRGERVVYIDTSNAFSAPRVLDMLRAMAPAEQLVSSAEALKCITVIDAYSVHDVLAALDALLEQHARQPPSQRPIDIQQQLQPPQNNQLHDQTNLNQPHAVPASPQDTPRFIALDSIGAVVAPILGGGGGGIALHGHAVLSCLASLLKQVAMQLRTVVLVTNHTVGGGGGAGSVQPPRNGTRGPSTAAAREVGRGDGAALAASTAPVPLSGENRAALGESWRHQAHVRVQLSLPENEGEGWIAKLQAGCLSPPGRSVRYWLTRAGVVGGSGGVAEGEEEPPVATAHGEVN